MVKEGSSGGLIRTLSDRREVKTFDNQRNAEQAGNMVGIRSAQAV
jgi:hypothetical protein